MTYYIVDRVEGDFAVCEFDGSTMVNISRTLLPEGTKEGSVLSKGPDGSFVLEAQEEQRRREELQKRSEELFDE